jgi:hypothetical protein
MPARFKDLCLDASDHQALTDWWCAALGYVRQVSESPRLLDWPVPIEDPAGQTARAVLTGLRWPTGAVEPVALVRLDQQPATSGRSAGMATANRRLVS